MPHEIEPQLATLVSAAPVGNQWLHEIKLDGYRAICRIEKGRAKLFTRRALDWTARFKAIARAVEELGIKSAILDGEVVVLDPSGISSFQALQTALSEKADGRLSYYVFDLLYLDGYDLRQVALVDRKTLLARLLSRPSSASKLRYNEHLQGSGPEFLRQCCAHGLEGVVSKRGDRPYRAGRGPDWLKAKCIQREEFVIGGFTDPTASRQGLGALLVGYYDKPGHLLYAGRVGTGFSSGTLVELRRALQKIERDDSPFANLSRREAGRGVHWVAPKLVCQVEFTNWTRDLVLRHPSFQGLREDLPAASVVRDAPVPGGLAQEPAGRKRSTASAAQARSSRIAAADGDHLHAPRRGTSKAAAPPKPRAVASEAIQFAGVRLTHPDRALYADAGVSKLGLASYYAKIADWILPHVANRPLSLLRCPEGCDKPCFFQKNIGAGAPEALSRLKIKSKDTTTEFAVVEDLAGLVALVQMNVLEIHPWGSQADDPERPDRLIFDLDPGPGVAWSTTIGAARRLHDLLDELEMASFVKTTGGKGLHIVVPTARRHSWEEVKRFARAVVERLAAQYPNEYVTKSSKAARRNKIFLDYLRNDRGATAVVAYSTRARPGATVSVPLSWDELSPAVHSDHFHVQNVPALLAALKRDPWAGLTEARQSITAGVKRVLEL
jgi:bifunctional non-homologous end joining protein LigD